MGIYGLKLIDLYCMDSFVERIFLGIITGKSLPETLIFASINPQYDNRLFMELL